MGGVFYLVGSIVKAIAETGDVLGANLGQKQGIGVGIEGPPIPWPGAFVRSLQGKQGKTEMGFERGKVLGMFEPCDEGGVFMARGIGEMLADGVAGQQIMGEGGIEKAAEVAGLGEFDQGMGKLLGLCPVV